MPTVVGRVIVYAEAVRRHRRRQTARHHARCLCILASSVVAARAALDAAAPDERRLRAARLHKLEDLHAYARALG